MFLPQGGAGEMVPKHACCGQVNGSDVEVVSTSRKFASVNDDKKYAHTADLNTAQGMCAWRVGVRKLRNRIIDHIDQSR